MMKRLTALLVLVALALGALATDADARRRKKSRNPNVGVSDVTLEFNDREPTLDLRPIFTDVDDSFSGTISRVKGCDGRQQVTVRRASGASVGSTVAAASGDWVLTIEDPGSDTYYAVVNGVTKRTGKMCARGTSALYEAEDSRGNLLEGILT